VDPPPRRFVSTPLPKFDNQSTISPIIRTFSMDTGAAPSTVRWRLGSRIGRSVDLSSRGMRRMVYLPAMRVFFSFLESETPMTSHFLSHFLPAPFPARALVAKVRHPLLAPSAATLSPHPPHWREREKRTAVPSTPFLTSHTPRTSRCLESKVFFFRDAHASHPTTPFRGSPQLDNLTSPLFSYPLRESAVEVLRYKEELLR